MTTSPTRALPRGAQRILLLYAIAAVAWIVLSDQVVALLFSGAAPFAFVSTLKGMGFVVATSLLLAVLLRQYERDRSRYLADLAQRERGFRLLADHAQDVIFRYRVAPTRGVEYVSPSVEGVLGHSPDRFYTDPTFLDSLLHPDDVPIAALAATAVPMGDVALRRFRASDGSWVPLEVRLVRTTDGPPGTIAIEGVARDVTERLRTEAELQRVNRVLRILSAANRALVRAEDEATLLTTIASAVVEEGGFRLAWVGFPESGGTAIRPVAHAGDAAGYLDGLVVDQRDVPEGRGPVGTSFREGRTVIAGDIATDPTMAPWRDEAVRRGFASVAALPLRGRSATLGAIAIYADERHAFGPAEVALLEELAADLAFGIETLRQGVEHARAEAERRRLAAAVAQSSESIVMTDAAGTIEYVNPAFERLTGYRREEVVGGNPRVLKSGVQPAAFYTAMWDTLTRGGTWRSDLVNRRKDGSLFTEEAVISAVHDGEGRTTGYVAVKRDVTRERAAEALAQTRARERSMIADALAAIRPHDEPEKTAAAICRQLIRFPDAAVALLLVFDPDGRASRLAGVTADGADFVTARLGAEAGRRLLTRAGEGPWVERIRSRGDETFRRALRARGVRSLAFAPVAVDGEAVAVLGIGAGDVSSAELAERLPALVEFAAIAGAAFGPTLSRRARVARVRERVLDIIRRQAFTPVFQPVVDLETNAVLGFEALTRFADGTPPQDQFREAAVAGLGIELEMAAVRAAVAAAVGLPSSGFLNLNVSPAAILDGHALSALIADHHGPLVLEITEHEAVDDYEAFRSAVARLGPKVTIAIDDVGAGFSSMRHILELRPGTVKLDRSFVAGIDRDPGRQAFVVGFRHFADSIHCGLVAEGIETEAELETLRSLGMPAGQGYLLGRPAPVGDIAVRTGEAAPPRGAGHHPGRSREPVRWSGRGEA